MTRFSYSINGNAEQKVAGNEIEREQKVNKDKPTIVLADKLFGSSIGRREYEMTDRAQVYGKLLQQWAQVRDTPNEANIDNLMTKIPVMPKKFR